MCKRGFIRKEYTPKAEFGEKENAPDCAREWRGLMSLRLFSLSRGCVWSVPLSDWIFFQRAPSLERARRIVHEVVSSRRRGIGSAGWRRRFYRAIRGGEVWDEEIEFGFVGCIRGMRRLLEENDGSRALSVNEENGVAALRRGRLRYGDGVGLFRQLQGGIKMAERETPFDGVSGAAQHQGSPAFVPAKVKYSRGHRTAGADASLSAGGSDEWRIQREGTDGGKPGRAILRRLDCRRASH